MPLMINPCGSWISRGFFDDKVDVKPLDQYRGQIKSPKLLIWLEEMDKTLIIVQQGKICENLRRLFLFAQEAKK